MKSFGEVLYLINKGKLKEAETLLKEIETPDGEYWYLVGLVAFFRGNEEVALDYFMKSLLDKELNISVRKGVKRAAAYLLFSRNEFEKTIKLIEEIPESERNVDDFFILFTSYLFIREYKKAEESIRKAYSKDRAKTKELLMKFYDGYVKPSSFSESTKKKLLELIESLQTNS